MHTRMDAYRQTAIADFILQFLRNISEPGIRRGNEDSRGNENRKSRKKNFSTEKQIDKHTFFFF